MKRWLDLGLEMPNLELEIKREKQKEKVRGFGAGNIKFGAGDEKGMGKRKCGWIWA